MVMTSSLSGMSPGARLDAGPMPAPGRLQATGPVGALHRANSLTRSPRLALYA